MSIFTVRQKMGIAALIMSFSVLCSRFMGLARDKIISWQFGAAGETDIYFAAFVVPDFLNYLLAGGYISITLIPLLSHRFEEDAEDGWKLLGTVFCWATLSIGFLSALCWFFAQELTPLVAPGFNEAQSVRLASFLRIILPAQVFFLPGACLCAVLYIRRQFFVPALMPLLYNGFILLFGLLFPWLGIAQGMEGFCWGVLFGACAGSFLLPLFAVIKDGFVFRPGLFHPLMKKFLLLALPLMIGQSVVVLDEQFVRIFGSMTGDGMVSLLNYARRIMMVPVGIVAQAAGVASFPFLASLAAKGDMETFRGTLSKTLTTGVIIAIPLTAWMFMIASPTLGFIFEGGRFSAEQTMSAAPLLQIMLIAVPFWLLQQVTGRAFYALQDTITPAIFGTAAAVLALPFYFYLVPIWGEKMVAVITTASIILYAFFLLWYAGKKWAKGAFNGIAKAGVRSLLLSLPGIGSIFFLECIFSSKQGVSPLLKQFLMICISGICFSGLWLLFARLLCREYFDLILSPFLRRFHRRNEA